MTDFDQWAARWPQAAAELVGEVLRADEADRATATSEAAAQQRARLAITRAGAMAWRNNVGATPAACKSCGAPQQPVRYGLANESTKLNQRFKSSDLILAIPRVIRPADVGRTFAQFGSVEVKPAGWRYTGTGREPAQSAWLALVAKLGGFAQFSTGDVAL